MKLATKLFLLIPSTAIVLIIFALKSTTKSESENTLVDVNSNEITHIELARNYSTNILSDLKDFEYKIFNNVCEEMAERDDFMGKLRCEF
jgi:hypothetical protein